MERVCDSLGVRRVKEKKREEEEAIHKWESLVGKRGFTRVKKDIMLYKREGCIKIRGRKDNTLTKKKGGIKEK